MSHCWFHHCSCTVSGRLGLLNLKGKKMLEFLLLIFLFPPTVDLVEYCHTFVVI